MPQFKKAASSHARNNPNAPRKAGSKSPKHRGFRAESDASSKKPRWSSDERVARGRGAERPRGGERPDWSPRGNDGAVRGRRDAEQPRGGRRFDRDERPAARGERPDRPTRFDRERPQRFERNDRPQRFERDDRPRRFEDDRPRRFDRDERPSRDRDERPARGYDRDERPRRFEDDRPRRFDRDERPARDDRPARGFNRDERPRRFEDDRPRRFDRDDRAPREDRGPRDERRFERPRREASAHPSRSYGDRPRRDDLEREPRSFEDRRDSRFYPERAERFEPQDDVVLERLEAEAIQAEDVEGVSFADLGLGANITRVLGELGATSPFPIQAATIPDVLSGKDVLGRGRTGSGKTIAFGAPLAERLLENGGAKGRKPGRAPRALILAPTRELALQIDRTVQPIARSVGLFTTQIYGGVPQARQVGALNRGVDIIIGTPGRIEDLVEQGRLDLSEVAITVLDEADHMCDLGFLEPVQRILRQTKEGGQKLLFSATLDRGVANLVDEFLVDPAVHEVAGEDQASSTIDHRVLLIDQRDKREIIEQLASGDNKTLVFARTRAFAEELAEQLDDAGIPAVSLHGDLNQSRRTRNLEKLTSGRVNVLVATDVAARGIHVDDITLVVQADAPDEYKTYLHRAGRTGRAGKQGTVVTLITRARRRRMEELLGRAEIEATVEAARPGDALVSDLVTSAQ
ncbi:DEAD/DEAH box helicase [Desertivibrio insolitus]|uniref:DEAD/DEAH box helicase n=1 Tax=Herbiconiux sp. SYSU D00978 TaxID=2812562 RepID=UPI001A969496|nr:DEAD/DEAH box helicase [Herbiconiux sp. SYSU D00978]